MWTMINMVSKVKILLRKFQFIKKYLDSFEEVQKVCKPTRQTLVCFISLKRTETFWVGMLQCYKVFLGLCPLQMWKKEMEIIELVPSNFTKLLILILMSTSGFKCSLT